MSTTLPATIARVQRSRRLPAEVIRSLRQTVVFEALEARRVLSAAVAGEALIKPFIDPSIVIDDSASDDSDAGVNASTDLTDDGNTDAGEDTGDETVTIYTLGGEEDTGDTSTDEGDDTGIFDEYVNLTPTASVIVVEGPTVSGTIATFELGRGTAAGFTLSVYLDDADVSSSAAIVDNGDGTASIMLGKSLDATHADGSAAELSYGISDDEAGLYGYGSSPVITSAAGKGSLLVTSITTADEQWVETSDDAQSISIANIYDQNGDEPDSFAVTVNWGDCTTSAGFVEDNGDGTFFIGGDHAYAATGTYHVSATVAGTNATLNLTTDVEVSEPQVIDYPIETIGGGIDWSTDDGLAYTNVAPKPYVRGTSVATHAIDAPVTPTTPTARPNFGGPATNILFSRSSSITNDMFGAETIESRLATPVETTTKHKKDDAIDVVQ